MRWTYCHKCNAEDETEREDKSIVSIFECHCCWQDYCERHGSIRVRICEDCLESAYRTNETI